ncbi:hypothetical protein CARUB_v10015067mg [Capsella rubella]|uniref:Uncharacterized protein n=1 Tax=Capsella rubella TaxID=81985 RepID=R0G8I9_9BRAS|nr:hypothetical protein CARUB_v10015067mg [Capsella rubella]
MKCPAALCEAIVLDLFSRGFVLLYINVKEHKDPKFLSEGLLWMGYDVDDLSVSLLKLKMSKGFLKHALLSALDAEYEKKPFKVYYLCGWFKSVDMREAEPFESSKALVEPMSKGVSKISESTSSDAQGRKYNPEQMNEE